MRYQVQDVAAPQKRKLLDQVKDAIRIKHYSPRTEEAYTPLDDSSFRIFTLRKISIQRGTLTGSGASFCFTTSAIPLKWARRKSRELEFRFDKAMQEKFKGSIEAAITAFLKTCEK